MRVIKIGKSSRGKKDGNEQRTSSPDTSKGERRESEAHLGILIDSIAQARWETNAVGKVVTDSPTWRAYTGQTEEEWLGDGWVNAVHPDDRSYAEQLWQEAIEQQTSINAEFRLQHPSGTWQWTNVRAVPILNDDGTLRKWVGINIDITVRKRAEEALHESEERYRTLAELSPDAIMVKVDGHIVYANLAAARLLRAKNPAELIGHSPFDLLLPEYQEFTRERIEEILENGGKNSLAELPWRRFDGSIVETETTAAAISWNGQRAAQVTLRDMTNRKLVEERSHLLQLLASSLSNAVTKHEVIDTIIQYGVNGVGAEAGVIALLSEDRSHLDIIGAFGYSQEVVATWRPVLLNDSAVLIKQSVRNRKPDWIHAAIEASRLAPGIPAFSPTELYQAGAVLPFNIRDQLLGVIVMGFNTSREFDALEQALLVTMTGYCAQALERTRLTEQTRQLAVVAERQRFARDLHDAVSQVLFAATTMAEVLPRVWERDPAKAMTYLREVVTLNRGAMAELRQLLLELRPEAIERTPFGMLLEYLAQAIRAQKRVETELHIEIDNDGILPPDPHVAIYRIAQEAINNIIKHSRASHITIHCVYHNPNFRLLIEDDGKGFDPTLPARGFGTTNMRERAEAIGATLEIVSKIGQGTKISVIWQGKKIG